MASSKVTHRNFFLQQWTFMLQSYEHFNVTIVDFHLPNTGPQCHGAFLMLFHPQIQEIRSCGKRLSWCIYIGGKKVNGLLIHLMVQLFLVVGQFGVSRSITRTISARRTTSPPYCSRNQVYIWFKQYLLDQPNTCTIGVQYYHGLLIIVLCTITP